MRLLRQGLRPWFPEGRKAAHNCALRVGPPRTSATQVPTPAPLAARGLGARGTGTLAADRLTRCPPAADCLSKDAPRPCSRCDGLRLPAPQSFPGLEGLRDSPGHYDAPEVTFWDVRYGREKACSLPRVSGSPGTLPSMRSPSHGGAPGAPVGGPAAGSPATACLHRLRRHRNHRPVTSGCPGLAGNVQGVLGGPVQEYGGLTEPSGCNVNAYRATAPTRGREQESRSGGRPDDRERTGKNHGRGRQPAWVQICTPLLNSCGP